MVRDNFLDGIIPDQYRMLHAFHQAARQGKTGAGDKIEPVDGESRSQHRHSQNIAFEAADARHFEQHLFIGNDIRFADVETAIEAICIVQHSVEI